MSSQQEPKPKSYQMKFGATNASTPATKADVLQVSEEGREWRNWIMGVTIGVVVFVVVTFVVELIAMHMNYDRDRSMAEQYTSMVKDHFETTIRMNDKINALELEVASLKAKNSYLR